MVAVISTKQYNITYGMLLGTSIVTIGILMYYMEYLYAPPAIFLPIRLILPILIISFGIWKYKNDIETPLSWNDALKVGIGIALIAGIIEASWEIILSQYLVPDHMDKMLALQKEGLHQQQNLSEEQIKNSIELSKKLSGPLFTIPLSLIKSLFFGFIISAVAGAIMQNKQKR